MSRVWPVIQPASAEARNAITPATSSGRPIRAENTNNADVAQRLRKIRDGNVAVFGRRIRADVEAGVLPAGTDALALARFTGIAMTGMSQSARDGASRDELERVAALAIRAWP